MTLGCTNVTSTTRSIGPAAPALTVGCAATNEIAAGYKEPKKKETGTYVHTATTRNSKPASLLQPKKKKDLENN